MIKFTTTLSDKVYQDSLALRKEVFMDEQDVPLELEIEDEDQCIHFVLYGTDEEAVATCRLFPKENNTVKLQRMAVKKEQRKNGLGKQIMLAAEEYALNQKYDAVFLDAQTHALGFYKNLGYEAFGDEFLDAGIPHYSMKKNLS